MNALQEEKNFPKYPMSLADKESQRFIREIATHSVQELFEALHHLKGAKTWRDQEHEIDRDELLEEFVDSFKFFVETLILCGFNENDLFQKFAEKTDETFERLFPNEESAKIKQRLDPIFERDTQLPLKFNK